MDFFRFSETDDLDAIGMSYDDSAMGGTHISVPLTRAVASEWFRRRLERNLESSEGRPGSTTEDMTESTTTGDYGTRSSSSRHADLFVHRHGDDSIGFTFSGQPSDVVAFRSCIRANAHRPHAKRGAVRETPVEPPRQNGPFNADVLCIILLYVDVSSSHDIVQVCRTCRFWAFYGNLAPHWTFMRRKVWSRRKMDLPKYVRSIVVKPKIVTRDEYIRERQKVEEYRRRERLVGTAKHLRWCVAVTILVGVMLTANFVIAYFLGFLRTALRSDVNLAITTFVLMIITTVLEVMVVIMPLAGGSTRDRMTRVLSWGLLMLVVSIIFGTISALAFTRVQAGNHVLDGATMDLTMDARCTTYSSKGYPSFGLLPAVLHDLRWRPITMDDNEESLVPLCLRKNPEKLDSRQQCYVLLYFDWTYNASVFHNATALHLGRDVGERTALGYDPTATAQPQPAWCAGSAFPQIISLTTKLYADVATARARTYPTDADWLDPNRRPSTFGNYSYVGSIDVNRESTENPRGSTDIWYESLNATAWTRHSIPLLSTTLGKRETFQYEHDHFLDCAFTCYIISGVLCGIMMLAQCIFKSAALSVLGVTTVAAVICCNPFTLMIAGALCVNVSDSYFMCSRFSGGSLIGGGVGLLFLSAVVYVSL